MPDSRLRPVIGVPYDMLRRFLGPAAADFQARRLALVVDDSQDARDATALLLEGEGFAQSPPRTGSKR